MTELYVNNTIAFISPRRRLESIVNSHEYKKISKYIKTILGAL